MGQWGDRAVHSRTKHLLALHDNYPPPRSLGSSTNALDSNPSCQRPRSMGLFSIFLASLLVPHRDGRRSGDPEDLEKARQEEEFAGDEDDDEDEEQRRGPEANGQAGDDCEYVDDSDPQDDGEDEPEETPRTERRVTFGDPSGESRQSSEKDDVKPGIFARFKAVIFPSRDDDKPLSGSNHRVLPIISGLIIPFSILLEIPGLTDNWYIRTDGNVVVETKPNPVILDVGLGFSMFFALVANISLICRFLDKGPVLVTTLISVTSLTVHGNLSHQNIAVDSVSPFPDSINIVALVAFGVLHRFSDGFTYGQGYWMTGTCIIPEVFIAPINGPSVFYKRLDRHQPFSSIGCTINKKL